MPKVKLSKMQSEIVWAMFMDEDLVIELEQGEFPWIYCLRKGGRKGGTFYPSTPVVALMQKDFLVKDPVLVRWYLNHHAASTWTAEDVFDGNTTKGNE